MRDFSSNGFSFYELVDMLVDFERKNHGYSLKEMSAILNIDEGHVRKMNAPSVKRHYTFEHLYILSLVWKIDINVFLPSQRTLRQLTAFKELSEKELTEVINNLISNMKGSNYNV